MATTAVAELVLPIDYFGQAKVPVPMKVLETTPMAYYTNFLPGGALERFFQVDAEVARNLKETAQQHIAALTDETWAAHRVAYEEFKRTFVVTQYLLAHRQAVYNYFVILQNCIERLQLKSSIYRFPSAAELSEHKKLYDRCIIVHNVLKTVLQRILEITPELEAAKALLSLGC